MSAIRTVMIETISSVYILVSSVWRVCCAGEEIIACKAV